MRMCAPLVITLLTAVLIRPSFAQPAVANDSSKTVIANQIENKNTAMEKLSFLVGKWKYIAFHEKKGDDHTREVETGKFIARFGPGKNSLIVELHGNGANGEDVVMDLICWNEKLRQYETVTTGSSFAGMLHGKAHWEKENFVMELSTSKNIRIIYKQIRDNEFEIEEWFQSGAEPYKLSMKMKVSRT